MLQSRLLQAANCVGDWDHCTQAQELFTVSTAEAQIYLVVGAAILSLIKCVLGVGSYSYFHVGLGGLSLTCTVLALAVFIGKDYRIDFIDQVQAGYGDDIRLYLLAYCGAIVIEYVDIATSYMTIATYGRVKRSPETFGYDRSEFKKGAATIYLKTLLLATVLSGILPLIAFGRSGWNTDFFRPTNFDQDNAKLIMSALILYFITYGLMATTIVVTALAPARLMVAVFVASCIGLVPLLASTGILYMVVGRTNDAEAGGLSYLLMMIVIQGVAFCAEFSRHVHWLQIELLGKALMFQQQQQEQQEIGIIEDFKVPGEEEAQEQAV